MFYREKLKEGSDFFKDGSKFKGAGKNVIIPNDETELRDGVRYSNKGNTKITISCNRTGKQGGALPFGGDVVYMGNMSGVLGIGSDEKGVYIKALAGTCMNAIFTAISKGPAEEITPGASEKMRSSSLRFPVDLDPTSSIGGCISANRSGIRDHVKSIKVVFSDSTFMVLNRGEYFADGRRMMFPAGRNFFSFEIPDYESDGTFGPKISKDMDLIDLFIGSEGIFGIITEAEVYLSAEAKNIDTKESGKMNNHQIKEAFGQGAVDDINRVKRILDPNGILNVGNLI